MTKNITFTDHSDSNLNIYFKDVQKYETLEQSEESRLFQLVQQGDWKARNQIIQANLAYVISVANEYSNEHINVKDLIQAGNWGLTEAVNTFDPNLGYRFLTHANNSIRKRIIEELADNFTVHIPDNEYRAIRAAKNVDYDEALYNNHDLSELSERAMVAFDRLDMSDDNNNDYADYDSEKLCEQQSQMDYILARIGSMPQRQAKAVRMALGLENGFECALETIADALSISVEGARLLSNKGLSELKESLSRLAA